jgi:threonine dehydrogenase-like Zn-dependent dehydrogenase
MTTMKTVVMRDNRVQVEDAQVPEPGNGQVLVRSRACGICGSDLHITRKAQEILAFYQQVGLMDESVESLAISLGHEFSAEIVAFGPATERRLSVGQRVTSIPFLNSEKGKLGIGTTPGVYGAYSEYFLLNEAWLLPVPEGLPDEAVAITEPMAIGLHSVNQGQPQLDEVALVAGCGPIGLACISALHLRGVRTIIASDPRVASRELAARYGATQTIDPRVQDEMLLAEKLAHGHRVVIFECVGIPTVIPDFIIRAPERSCIVFTGLHTGEVAFSPAHALVKQLNIKYAYYYDPQEYATCLEALASGDIPWRELVTGKVGIDGVPDAFKELMGSSSHIKVIIEPWRQGSLELTQYNT